MREHASWDPTAYGRFAGERSRPFADLVAQVRTDDPAAGRRPRLRPRPADADPRRALAERPGRRGRLLASRCSSRPAQLDHERAGRVGAVRPARVGPRLARPGPRRRRDQLDAAVAAGPPRPARRLGRGAGRRRLVRPAGAGQLRRPEPPADARDRRAPRAGRRARRRRSTCRRWGSPRPTCATWPRLGCDVDAWETTYLHVLDPDGEDDNPVLTWVAATGLRPVIDILTDDDELRRLHRRRTPRRSTDAYPRSSAGVLFPFRRVFAVARNGLPDRPDPRQLSRPMREPSPCRTTVPVRR